MPFARAVVCLILIAAFRVAFAQEAIDFSISKEYMQFLAIRGATQVGIKMHFNGRTKNVHALASDCEMHLAADSVDMDLGAPGAIVAEAQSLQVQAAADPKASRGRVVRSLCDEQGLYGLRLSPDLHRTLHRRRNRGQSEPRI